MRWSPAALAIALSWCRRAQAEEAPTMAVEAGVEVPLRGSTGGLRAAAMHRPFAPLSIGIEGAYGRDALDRPHEGDDASTGRRRTRVFADVTFHAYRNAVVDLTLDGGFGVVMLQNARVRLDPETNLRQEYWEAPTPLLGGAATGGVHVGSVRRILLDFHLGALFTREPPNPSFLEDAPTVLRTTVFARLGVQVRF